MTTFVYLTGTAKWAKLRTPDDKYQVWTMDLYLDDKGWATYNKTGLQLKLRESEDGKYIQVRRSVSKLIKGEIVNFDPPVVLDDNNKELDKSIDVGNGSKVTVKLGVYDTLKGKAHRLESVRADELVQYKKPEVIGDVDVAF